MSASWPFGTLTSLNYGVILADPPWRFANWSAKGEGRNPVEWIEADQIPF